MGNIVGMISGGLLDSHFGPRVATFIGTLIFRFVWLILFFYGRFVIKFLFLFYILNVLLFKYAAIIIHHK